MKGTLVSSCYFCDDWVDSDGPDASYVVSKSVTYKGKTFKGKRTNFHLSCYNKLLPRYKDAGLAQRQSE